MIEQAIQLVGAILVLAGFAGLQLGRLHVTAIPYLLLNAVGSGMLLAVAILDREWGFILLEGVWTGVSIFGIARVRLDRSQG